MELHIDLESSQEYYDLKIPTPMELQIDLESQQEYYDLKIPTNIQYHLIFWRAGAWCLWNQAQEAEHLAELGPGEDMTFVNDLCGELGRVSES